jgi:hypothetical protein
MNATSNSDLGSKFHRLDEVDRISFAPRSVQEGFRRELAEIRERRVLRRVIPIPSGERLQAPANGFGMAPLDELHRLTCDNGIGRDALGRPTASRRWRHSNGDMIADKWPSQVSWPMTTPRERGQTTMASTSFSSGQKYFERYRK